MDYKISDVSKLLNVSKEMIRYYEKSGAFHPSRKENNYRIYSIMDIFSLIEVIQYKELGINIKSIQEFIGNNFNQQYLEALKSFEQKLNEEISYKETLKRRIIQIKERNETCLMNLGNYWIEKQPDRYFLFFQSSKGDDYGEVKMPEELCRALLSSQNISFFDSNIFFGDNENQWWFSYDKCLYDFLSFPNLGERKLLQTQYFLCSIINMGDIGEFDDKCYLPALEFLHKNHYKKNGNIFGTIISRGIENGKLCRLMKIQIPVEKKVEIV